jgi:hypothetical protein
MHRIAILLGAVALVAPLLGGCGDRTTQVNWSPGGGDSLGSALPGLARSGDPLGVPAGSTWIPPDGSASSSYAVEEWSSGSRFVLLDRVISRPGGLNPDWKVVAILEVPTLLEGEALVGGVCGRDARNDPDLVAIVNTADQEDLEWYQDVRAAWQANRSTRHFDSVGVEGVRCHNESYGL